MPSVMIAEDDLFMADMLEEALAAERLRSVRHRPHRREGSANSASVASPIWRSRIFDWRMAAWARRDTARSAE